MAARIPRIAFMPRLLAEPPRAGQGLPGRATGAAPPPRPGLRGARPGRARRRRGAPRRRAARRPPPPTREPRTAVEVDAEQPARAGAEPEEAEQAERR